MPPNPNTGRGYGAPPQTVPHRRSSASRLPRLASIVPSPTRNPGSTPWAHPPSENSGYACGMVKCEIKIDCCCSWTAAVRRVRWTTSTASGSITPRTRRECSFRRHVAFCSTTTRGTSSSKTFTDVNSTPSSTLSVSATRSRHRYTCISINQPINQSIDQSSICITAP